MARAEELPWVDVSDLLTATGARNLTRSGDEFSFSCPSDNHAHGDASPSAGMNFRSSLWRCRNPACGLRGNAADYLVALKGYTRSQALRVLQERYGGPEQSVEAGALLREVERIREQHECGEETRVVLTEDEYLDRFAVHWPDPPPRDLPDPMRYMLDRGFSPRTLNEFQVGYDDVSGRVTIPVHDERGQLVGIKGRAWWPDAVPRYISIGDAPGREPRYGFQTYQKSRYVFGLHRAASRTAIICEGELNAMALHQMGHLGAVAVAGSEFSERQARLIASRFEHAVVYFDDDEAGYAGTQRVAEALHEWMPVFVVEGARGDAADALDQRKDFSSIEVQERLAFARSWLSLLVGDSARR